VQRAKAVEVSEKESASSTRLWKSLLKPTIIASKLGLLGAGMMIGFGVSRLLSGGRRSPGASIDFLRTNNGAWEDPTPALRDYADEQEMPSVHAFMMERIRAKESHY